MKKSIQILLVMLFVNSCLEAQQLNQVGNSELNSQAKTVSVTSFTYGDPVINKDYDYYMKKSRNNRTASWCLVGGGFVIAGIGALTFPKNYDPIWENDSDTESKADASTALIVVGCAAMLSSIPFTVMASVNKRKANVMVSSQKTGFGVPPNVSKHITGITMAISIGK